MKAGYLALSLSLWASTALYCQAFLLRPATRISNVAVPSRDSSMRMGAMPANGTGTVAVAFDSVALAPAPEPFEQPLDMASSYAPTQLQQQRWLRRLNTKEDFYFIHKISSLTSCASSLTIILAMLSTGLQEFPAWLGPVDATFVASNLALCLTTVHMVGAFRRQEDSIAKTHLSAGFHSLIMTLYATWESPYCTDLLDTKLGMETTFCTLILLAAYIDLKTFSSNDIVPTMWRKYGLTKEGLWQAIVRAITFDVVLLVPTIMNLVFMFFILYWDLDRHQWHSAMVQGFGVPCLTGNSMEYIYFANVCITFGIGLQSFVGTLCHKRLLSTDNATAFVGLVNVVLLSLLGMCVIAPWHADTSFSLL